MSARNINPFKGTHILWRLRAKARTGVKAPGFVMANLTATPPCIKPAQPRRVPTITLPTDKLLATLEKKFPEVVSMYSPHNACMMLTGTMDVMMHLVTRN